MCNKLRQKVLRTVRLIEEREEKKSLRANIIGGIKYIGACHDISLHAFKFQQAPINGGTEETTIQRHTLRRNYIHTSAHHN